jgi:hypothetical protein
MVVDEVVEILVIASRTYAEEALLAKRPPVLKREEKSLSLDLDRNRDTKLIHGVEPIDFLEGAEFRVAVL